MRRSDEQNCWVRKLSASLVCFGTRIISASHESLVKSNSITAAPSRTPEPNRWIVPKRRGSSEQGRLPRKPAATTRSSWASSLLILQVHAHPTNKRSKRPVLKWRHQRQWTWSCSYPWFLPSFFCRSLPNQYALTFWRAFSNARNTVNAPKPHLSLLRWHPSALCIARSASDEAMCRSINTHTSARPGSSPNSYRLSSTVARMIAIRFS